MRSTLFAAGDGRLGYPPEAPYDAIHVGAAAAVVPDAVSLIISVFFPWSALNYINCYSLFYY